MQIKKLAKKNVLTIPTKKYTRFTTVETSLA